jgi:hypothetical protein
MPLPDYRCLDYPYDDQGYPFFAENDDCGVLNPNSTATLDDYLSWLSTYLMKIQLTPRGDQLRWWNDHAGCPPDSAIRALGSDIGIQDAIASFDDLNSNNCDEVLTNPDWQWPHDVCPPVDVGYRVLLAQVLNQVADHTQRKCMLQSFFQIYWEYTCK